MKNSDVVLFPGIEFSYIFMYLLEEFNILLKIFIDSLSDIYIYIFNFFNLFIYFCSYSADFPNQVPVFYIIKCLLIFCLVYFATLLARLPCKLLVNRAAHSKDVPRCGEGLLGGLL